MKNSIKKTFVFLGSTNSMPMMYALDLKKDFDVIYFVDADKSNALHRPECHFPSINYPYPEWIIELSIKNNTNIAFFKFNHANFILSKIKQLTASNNLIFVLNGHYTMLAPKLKKHGKIICLSHGSDLDEWGYIETNYLTDQNRIKSKFTIQKIISAKIIAFKKKCQLKGFLCAEKVIYFPKGFSIYGDKVVSMLVSKGIKYIPRFDTSFAPLTNANRDFKCSTEKLVIFSGVRFYFNAKTTPPELSKGNDIIIQGLAEYAKLNDAVEIHFVEKGQDVDLAKSLCEKYGIQDFVIWHKEMPFIELLKLYEISDICFDQLGRHWLGGIGIYALWLGKPTIANVSNQIASKCIPITSPICNASTVAEVKEWLIKLNDERTRKAISENSKQFAESFFSISRVLTEIADT